jgi:hypothetical protein
LDINLILSLSDLWPWDVEPITFLLFDKTAACMWLSPSNRSCPETQQGTEPTNTMASLTQLPSSLGSRSSTDMLQSTAA